MAKAKKEADFAVVTDRVLADWRAARRRLLDSRAAAPAMHDWRICTRRLLALRRAHPALRLGDLQALVTDGDVLVLRRQHADASGCDASACDADIVVV